MGLFKRKKGKEEKRVEELPKLPELPELPKLPGFKTLPPLPKYPSTTFGNEFSQKSIKEAVAGKKEDEIEADEFVKEQMMPISQRIKHSKISKMPHIRERRPGSKKPVFIRIDKFEESLRIFEETKEKIFDIEKLLSEIKHLKEKEGIELSDWSAEIHTIKNQIEKVERDIFSKIE